MTAEQYAKLCAETPNVKLVRPAWNEERYHRDGWQNSGVTVLICQRKTKDITQLCIESLLRFYPDIPVLVVDGDSQDDSTLYLRYKSIVSPNIRLWERSGINSHGVTMNEAIHNFINTEYVLLMDSDIITMRGGYVEGMLDQLRTSGGAMYATGTLMLVTRKNNACGPPFDNNDVLRYAHPSCSLYHVPTYKSLNAPFADHGAPCVYNMFAAEQRGLQIGYYPIDKYVAHLSGASWHKPRTIWRGDHGVTLRPFVTFVATNLEQFAGLSNQDDHDFDIITPGNRVIDDVVIHGEPPRRVDNQLYDIRFRVSGEYVCVLDPSVIRFDKEIVSLIKREVVSQSAPDELIVGGLKIVKRQAWQHNESLL